MKTTSETSGKSKCPRKETGQRRRTEDKTRGKQEKIELNEAGQEDKLRQGKDDEAQRDSGIRKECEGGGNGEITSADER